MALVSTQPLTEMRTRNLPGGKKRPARWLTTLQPSMSRMSENVGASTSRNPKGLQGLYRDNFTFTFYLKTPVSTTAVPCDSPAIFSMFLAMNAWVMIVGVFSLWRSTSSDSLPCVTSVLVTSVYSPILLRTSEQQQISFSLFRLDVLTPTSIILPKLQELAQMIMIRCYIYVATLHESYSCIQWNIP
jgi:hypothetical protein